MPDVDDDLDEPSSRETWCNPVRLPKSEGARTLIGEVLHQVRNYKQFLKVRRLARTAEHEL
jgi:hypothetical protein